MLKKHFTPLLFALLPTVAYCQDFADPNTKFLQTQGFTGTTDGQILYNKFSAFYVRGQGNVKTRVFLLPEVKVNNSKINAVFNDGNSASLEDIDDYEFEKIKVIEVPISYRSYRPNAENGSHLAAALNNDSIQLVMKPQSTQLGGPVMTQRAAYTPHIAGPINMAFQKAMTEYNKSRQYSEKWKQYNVEDTAILDLNLTLNIDGESVSSRNFSGTSINQHGNLPKLIIKNPTKYQINRIKNGGFDIQVKFSMKDTNAQSINANYDFSQRMNLFVSEYQKSFASSKKTGFQFLGIGSRRTRTQRFINSESKRYSQQDTSSSTTIEFEDADADMISYFEDKFFPTIAKDKLVDNHLKAAAEARQRGNNKLGQLHEDYARAIKDEKMDLEVDTTAALAALARKDIVGFIANGLKFHNSSNVHNSEYRQVITLEAGVMKKEEFSMYKLRTTKRSVNFLLQPNEAQRSASLGGFSYIDMDGMNQYGNQEKHILITCIQEAGPLAKANIIPGMFLRSVNGIMVNNGNHVFEILKDCKPGETINVSFYPMVGSYQWQSTQVRLISGGAKLDLPQ